MESGLVLEKCVNGRAYRKRLRNWYLIDRGADDSDCFTWGYHGSGPSYTSYSILRELFGKKLAAERYHEFAELFIFMIPEDSELYIDGDEICRMLGIRTGKRRLRKGSKP